MLRYLRKHARLRHLTRPGYLAPSIKRSSCHVCFWHKADMLVVLRNVRFRV